MPGQKQSFFSVVGTLMSVDLDATWRKLPRELATSIAEGRDPSILEGAPSHGQGYDFDPEYSHVIPAIIKKFVDAKQRGASKIIAWGTGNATREFLYVEGAAEGIVLAGERYNKPDRVNLSAGQEIKIKDLVY